MPEGAAIERTRLAWRRTMLVFSVTEIVMIVTIARRGVTPLRGLALALALLIWLGCLLVSQRRIRTMDSSSRLMREEHLDAPNESELQRMAPPPLTRTVTLIGLAVTLLATLGLILF